MAFRRSRLHCKPQNVHKYRSCQLCSFSPFLGKKGEVRRCLRICSLRNELTNLDEMKIKRGEVGEIACNKHLSPAHSLNQVIPLPLSLYFCSFSQFLSFPFSCHHPSVVRLLIPPRGTVGCCRSTSNRCLITVLIAGHRETHTFL